MRESDLYEQVAQYMALKHPQLVPLTHFDLSGVWTPSHAARNLYGRLNRRAWPDFFLARPAMMPDSIHVAHGLFLELKREGTRLKKVRSAGQWASRHIEEQAAVLDELANQGYIAQFAVGFDAAVEIIESYLGNTAAADGTF